MTSGRVRLRLILGLLTGQETKMPPYPFCYRWAWEELPQPPLVANESMGFQVGRKLLM